VYVLTGGGVRSVHILIIFILHYDPLLDRSPPATPRCDAVPPCSHANTSADSRHAYTVHIVEKDAEYPADNWYLLLIYLSLELPYLFFVRLQPSRGNKFNLFTDMVESQKE
jgi:hypothetical protein